MIARLDAPGIDRRAGILIRPIPRDPTSAAAAPARLPLCPVDLRPVVADSRTAPAVGTSDRRHAAQRHAAIDGAGWRDDGRDTLSVPRPRPAGHRGSRGAGAPSRTRSVARPRAWPSDTLTGGRVRRLARPAAPRPPPPALAARPGRPRAAPVPRRRLRPVAAVAWRTHRPPPSPSRLCVRLRLLHAGAGGSRPAGGLECRVLDPQPCAQHQQVQH